MPVTKQTYTAGATWTTTSLANIFRSAFIDAGLMTDWYDSFTISSTNIVRVLRIEHDSTKAYGSSFYAFFFSGSLVRVHLTSGWNPSSGSPPVSVPTGTQYLDYRWLPSDYPNFPNAGSLLFSGSNTSNAFIDRYTSGDDPKQSWFVVRSGSAVGQPFLILHKDTVLHPWLDLGKGIVSGLIRVSTATVSGMGMLTFRVEENIRRCLAIGTALRNQTNQFGFHNIKHVSNAYVGLGSSDLSDSYYNRNFPRGAYDNTGDSSNNLGGTVLPVGKNSANPAFTTDYLPICTDLAWSSWTPTRLANDFGIYMHYASNAINHGDMFIVQSSVNEWQVLSVANNATVNDGASATFLARTV